MNQKRGKLFLYMDLNCNLTVKDLPKERCYLAAVSVYVQKRLPLLGFGY